jgi:hypothetical protein
MGQIKSFFKVTPQTIQTTVMQNGQDMDGSAGATSHYTSYARLHAGSVSRLTSYEQYNQMDSSVEVSRALDIIAEEMSSKNIKTGMPVDIEINQEDGNDIDDSVTMTLRAACRAWCAIHGFDDNKIFKIARTAIKYGDCFFRKRTQFNKWEWVPSPDVVGVAVDSGDVTRVQAYQLKKNTKSVQNNSGYRAVNNQYNTEWVPADQMVVFSLSDAMGITAPFGESILQSAYKIYTQLKLFEDSVLIYRISRAPERRVFNIPTGKMPANRIAAYLTRMKNELRQKQVPSNNVNGGDSVDSVYNPQSMLEDYFFAVGADGVGAKVDVLPGGQNLGQLEDLFFFHEKLCRALRVPIAWMKSGADSAMFNDGKVGASYVEEQQFCKFVERLQRYIDCVLDAEFKTFLYASNIHVDPNVYKIRLPRSSNYERYRQAELDQQLLNTFAMADNVQYLSKRFILQRFMQLGEDEISINEQLLKQERGLENSNDISIKTLYTANPEEMMGGGMGGGMGGMGGGAMGGMGDMGMPPPEGEMPPPEGEMQQPEGGMGGGMGGATSPGNELPPKIA